MIVKDEEGNERELQIGDLIGLKDASDTIKCVGRVTNYELYRGSNYVHWKGVGARYNDACTIDRAVYLSSEPPDDDKGMPIADRNRNLKNNLSRAISRCDGGSDDYHLLYRVVEKLEYPEQDHWFWWSVAESISDPRKISYAPTMRDVDNNARRRYCSVSKFLKGVARQKGLSITDVEADRMGQLVGNHFPNSYNYVFEVFRGFVQQAYRDSTGEMRSCMSGESSRYVRWYDENPEKVGIVKILQGGDYIGRALIWTTDQGDTVVDRVYPSNNGPHTNALHRWCEENGYDYKTCQSSCDGHFHSSRTDYTVTMVPPENNEFPYLDTFKYTDDHPEDSEAIKLNVRSGKYTFTSTGGGYAGGLRCGKCGDALDEDDCHLSENGEVYCESCYNDNFVYLEYTRPNGRHVEGEYDIDATCECEHCGDRFDADHCQHVETDRPGFWYWCEQCIEDNATQCCECNQLVGDWLAPGDVDGDPWCPSCFEKKCAECESCDEAHLKADLFKCVDEVRCAACCEGLEGARPLLEVEAEDRAAKLAEMQARTQGPAQQEAADGWRYPEALPCWERGCTCSYATQVARRRREYFLQQRPAHLERCNDRGCPFCRIDGLTLNEYIAAPYPNAHEREIIERQGRESEGATDPPQAGAINPATNPSWTQAPQNGEAGFLTEEAFARFRDIVFGPTMARYEANTTDYPTILNLAP